MSQFKAHKIHVRNRSGHGGKNTTGANVEVLLDGQPLKGAKSFKFEVAAGEVSKVTIQFLAEIEIEADVELTPSTVEPTDLKYADGSTVGLYTLSSPFPVELVTKKT